MTNLEIKKLYKATKAAYERRTGNKLKWFMTQQQMANGTATVCVAEVIDYEKTLACAIEYAERDAERDAAKLWRFEERMAREEAAADQYGRGRTFWRDSFEELKRKTGTETLDEFKAQKKQNADAWVEICRRQLEVTGGQAAETARRIADAEAMAAEPEVRAFLEKIGGTAAPETKREDDRNRVFLRFLYKADR